MSSRSAGVRVSSASPSRAMSSSRLSRRASALTRYCSGLGFVIVGFELAQDDLAETLGGADVLLLSRLQVAHGPPDHRRVGGRLDPETDEEGARGALAGPLRPVRGTRDVLVIHRIVSLPSSL